MTDPDNDSVSDNDNDLEDETRSVLSVLSTEVPKKPFSESISESHLFSPDEINVLEIIAESNGYSAESFLNRAHTLEKMELFMCFYPRMLCLKYFPGLRSLEIIGQEISVIEGLEGCPLLETLWLMNNKIKAISGLEHCSKIAHLHLNTNLIEKIEGISHLTELQDLFLCENRISVLENLLHNTKLKRLWLASNQIQVIGKYGFGRRGQSSVSLIEGSHSHLCLFFPLCLFSFSLAGHCLISSFFFGRFSVSLSYPRFFCFLPVSLLSPCFPCFTPSCV